MTDTRWRRPACTPVLGGVLLLVSGTVRAESDADLRDSRPAARLELEEVMVTAQKSEEPLRDVPISMTVLGSSFLAERAVTDLDDLSRLVGNFKVDTQGGVEPPPDIRIRGFGTAQGNRAFEQSVGLSIDGDTFGRQEYFQGALFDLQRVEILKGPQGTLFGKNTTAGLVNVVLSEPTNTASGFIDAQGGQLGSRRVEAAVGGPVIPNVLDVRIAGLVDDRDGYVRNTTAETVSGLSSSLGGRDRDALRLKLKFLDVLGGTVGLTGEWSRATSKGLPFEITNVTIPAVQQLYLKYDPNADTQGGNFVTSEGDADVAKLTTRRVVLNGDWTLGGWNLDLLVGGATLESPNHTGISYSPAPVGYGDFRDSSKQVTAEFRGRSGELEGLLGLREIFGLGLGSSRLTAGLFYQCKTYDATTAVGFNLPVYTEWALASFGIPPEPTGADAARQAPLNFLLSDYSDRTASYAAFTHLEWRPIDRWALELGMRLTREEKDADIRNYFNNATDAAIFGALGETAFDFRGLHLSSLAFTPKVALRRDLSENTNIFASWTRGFKSGGFNQQATSPDGIRYKDEVMQSWEVGSKSRFFDGRAAVDVQLFSMTAKDLQVFTVDDTGGVLGTPVVINAGRARSRGVELDMDFLPAKWLTLRASGGFDDTKYLDYQNGPCENDRQVSPGCNLTGMPLEFTPRFNGSLTSSIRIPLNNRGLQALTSLTAHYEGARFISRTDDPRTRESARTTLALQAGITRPDQGWTILISGENITNQRVAYFRDVAKVAGSMREYLDPPRVWMATMRWSF
ncbi:MAG: TonB-dependent receptor [Proteobacteria bacterium]|nr:TonB-dependent receptor [Pseudomonadota bacterium]